MDATERQYGVLGEYLPADGRNVTAPLLSAAEGHAANPDAFFNPTPPQVGVQHEQPQHRIMIMLRVAGHTVKDIAKVTGYSEVHVGNVLRQPWARARMLELTKQRADIGIDAILKAELIASVETLIEVRDEAPRPADRMAAANAILNRYLGTPTARVEVSSADPVDLESLKREEAALAAQEATLLGRGPARN